MEDLFIAVSDSYDCRVTPEAHGTFIPEDGFGYVQLIFLLLAYGFILTRASGLIADGSELLMVVMDPGLIGGLVLPVMGAVPDGAIVLFSGLGPNAQEQLKVGVGTLAGSTIMLLTIPWSLCAVVGRVDLVKDAEGQDVAKYQPKKGEAKLTKGWSLSQTGVQADMSTIRPNAMIMIATAITYLIIQGPSWQYQSSDDAAKKENPYALAGFILASISFVAYSVYQVFSQNALDEQAALKEARIKELAKEGGIGLEVLLSDLGAGADESSSDREEATRELREHLRSGSTQLSERDRRNLHVFVQTLFQHVKGLVTEDEFVDAAEAEIMIRSLVGGRAGSKLVIDVSDLVRRYGQNVNGAFVLDETQFEEMFIDWYIAYLKSQAESGARRACCSCADVGRVLDDILPVSARIFSAKRTADEAAIASGPASFTDISKQIAIQRDLKVAQGNYGSLNGAGATGATSAGGASGSASAAASAGASPSPGVGGAGSLAARMREMASEHTSMRAAAAAEHSSDDGETEAEEEEDEEEEETSNMTKGEIYVKSLFQILFGVGVVTVFSDPMVDVLSELGTRMNISAFYVSFIVTPLVSNASELISSIVFASKRSQKTITLTYSTLLGAATMNNTFCLAIFLALVHFQNLSWSFSAEVTTILVIEVIIAIIAWRRIQPLSNSIIVALLFPASIALVAILENVAGWD